MPRDHGRIRLDIWADEDWMDLPWQAQWLYLYLATSPDLSFCGVCDWRPTRIAPRAKGLTPEDVEMAALYLERGRFIVVDRTTEEVLIRSWIKHDGLLTSPNVTTAMVRAHGAVASRILREVIVDQLLRLYERDPDLIGWKRAASLLEKRSMPVEQAFDNLIPNPFANPLPETARNPSENPSGNTSENRPSLPTPYSQLPTPNSELPSGDQNSHLTSGSKAARDELARRRRQA